MSAFVNPTNGHHQSEFGQEEIYRKKNFEENFSFSATAVSRPINALTVHSATKSSSDNSKDIIQGKYIGIADLPNQVFRRILKKGFKLNLLILGKFGVGKSTLINSLFDVDIYAQNRVLPTCERIRETVQVEKNALEIEAKGVNIFVNILDVPNFGNFIDNSKSCEVVGQYIDQQLHNYFEASHQKRSQTDRVDERVHCCLYVIAPTGHSLCPLDISTMKHLGVRTNLIPVIGRADALTLEEREAFRDKIRLELKMNDVQIYYFPSDDEDIDENVTNKSEEEMRKLVPFATVGSNEKITGKNGVEIRVRNYPWGVLNVEDPRFSDLNLLRRLLLFNHLPDLVGITDGLHYSNYVKEFLNKNGQFFSTENEKNQKNQKIDSISKLELELQLIFDKKVEEKMRKLDEIQRELEKKYAEWEDQLSARKKNLRKEKEDFEHQKLVLIQAYPLLQERLNQEMLRSGIFAARI